MGQVTYLQSFDFFLKALDVVAHWIALEALVFVLLGRGGPL
jgi:hypothetical protein